MEQQIRFCTSADGTRIAYATYDGGSGTPLIRVPAWFVTQELAWRAPDLRAFTEGLAQGRRLVSFDRRGMGASQREVDDVGLDAQLRDLTATVDHLGLEQFDLEGHSDGAAVTAAYAAQHPERISRLVLYGPYPRGEDGWRPEAARSVLELIRTNWSLARRMLADISLSNASPEMRRVAVDTLREAVSPEVAAKYVQFWTSFDVSSLLPRVQAPALVLHPPAGRTLINASRAVAALIPDARLVVLEGESYQANCEETVQLVRQFLDEGRAQPPPAEPGGLVTILFTDMESSTALRQRLGDEKAQELVRAHNAIVREALNAHGGSEIKHTGDGIMASFGSASRGLECAVAIQRGVAAYVDERPEAPLGVYIGLNAGEPIAEEADLFGTSVDLAKRICDEAEPGQILASNVVRELSAGKGFLFSDQGETELRGFEDPVRLYEVRWAE